MNIQTMNESPGGRRLGGLAVVGLVHVVLVYALLMGTAGKIMSVLKAETIVEILPEVKPPPPEERKPPPPKLIQPPPLLVPPPEVQVQTPPAPNTMYAKQVTADTERTQAPPVVNPVQDAPPPVDQMEGAWLDTNKCDKPAYPWQLANRETGTVLLSLLIDVNGKVLESKVEKSSGTKLLDEAAKAGMSVCTYRPGSLNGQPVRSWKKIKVVWELPF